MTAYSLGVKKKIVEITLCGNISELNVFLHFTQKFKEAKNGGKTISGKKSLHIRCGPRISSKSLYLAPFLRH